MNFEATYLKNIISANNSGSLAIFIGAGISKSSETSSFKLPNWNDLIVSLKRELNDIEENDYLKVAQLYYLAFGEYTYYKKLKEFFPENITPSKVHEIIFDINPHIVLTTNWDNILERTIEENAHVYDVICSDSDLVKSSLPNKLIKMHGDFKNHNIVFKEDDYINYQFNFPLIENYVKSVLSTHTILFIGYSYNDTNLKQILNWIKNHSSVRPPMYLATFEENQTQLKYLENHGISSVILKDYDNDSIHGDEYSKKMYCFLNKIINQDAQRLLSSNDQVINFVLDKIEPLNDLNGILLDQIQESLSNCGFIYDDDSYPILEFYDQVLTTDLDTNIRGIYKRFIEVLKTIDEGSTPNPNMMKIFNILSKARVKGIVISSDDLNKNSKEYLSIEPYVDVKSIKENEKYYDFDFSDTNKKNIDLMGLFEQAFSYYNLNQFEDAFYTMEEIVSSCLKERNYTLLFIAMFNRNVLLRRIKYSYSDSRDKFKEVKEYNLKERYYKLPKILRLATYPIYEFVDFSLIYKYAYTVSEHLNQTEQSKKTIESGGLVFNSNIKQFSSKHENIVNFILSNKIMLENYKEYRIINKHFVEISILRQIQKGHTCLSKTELYSSIKLFDYKEIKDVFSDFYNNKSNENKKFVITSQDKEWLIKTVFPNIVDVFIKHNGSLGGNENHLKNLLFILSLVELSESEVAEIFDIIKTIILQGNNSIDIFQS
ncbi:SIR2 family protein, partial [Vibrio cholerae]|nr:SIR2 family protein [Vibrio cholerae]